MDRMHDVITDFARRNGLDFRDESLLRTALTHPSYLNEHPQSDWEDNERLEWLGDAVLDFLLADHLYGALPRAPEGELTGIRASLVRRATLARLATELGLGQAMLLGQGESEIGGRSSAANLCAAFEALVAAIHLDQGLDAVWRFVLPLMQRDIPASPGKSAMPESSLYVKDAKSRLQELAQARVGITPRYRTVHAEGPDHAKSFTVEVLIGETPVGRGEGASKQVAAQQAAEEALAQAHAWSTPDKQGDA